MDHHVRHPGRCRGRSSPNRTADCGRPIGRPPPPGQSALSRVRHPGFGAGGGLRLRARDGLRSIEALNLARAICHRAKLLLCPPSPGWFIQRHPGPS
jgi:hypothetical protein